MNRFAGGLCAHKPCAARRSRRSAFTLLELLTVIAVIVLLAALLFPALGKMKERGLSVKDANNLRQLGVAFSLHASEHDGKYPEFVYPPNSGWDMSLIPYLYPEVEASFLASASALQGYKGSLEVFHHPMDKVPRSHPRSYVINPCIYSFLGVYNIFGQAPYTTCRVLNVTPPVASASKFALLFPAFPTAGVVGASVGEYNGFTVGGPDPINVFKNGGNYLFADGHVEMVKLLPDYSNWYPYLWGTP